MVILHIVNLLEFWPSIPNGQLCTALVKNCIDFRLFYSPIGEQCGRKRKTGTDVTGINTICSITFVLAHGKPLVAAFTSFKWMKMSQKLHVFCRWLIGIPWDYVEDAK